MTSRSGDAAITIEPYDNHLETAHARFAERMWPAKRRRREARYNRWKFRGPSQGPVSGLLLAVSDGDVVGQLGLIPATLRIDDLPTDCQWACDLMVDSSRRRRGIASMLFAAALARDLATLGSNPSAAADVTMQRVGFRAVRGPGIGVFPIDPAHILGWKIPRSYSRTSAIAAAAMRPLMYWRGRRIRTRIGATFVPVEQGDWRLVARDVANAQARAGEPCIVHDDAFLAWRCEGLPGYAEPLTALRTRTGSYAIVGSGAPYFYVFDWFAASWEEFRTLFAEIRRRAVDDGAKTLQAYGQSPEAETWLRRAGFFVLRTPCRILCYPPERLIPKFARMRYSIFDSDGNL